MTDLAPLTAAIERGDRSAAIALTRAAIDAPADPAEILGAMTGAMDAVGGAFQRGELYVPEMMIAARAMKAGMELLAPVLVQAGVRPEHTAVVGTIEGDLHDIGKNLVGMMWKGANFAVVDLGVGVTASQFVAAVKEHAAELVGVSALLTTTMPNMQAVVDAVHAAAPGVKVLVGGAPVTAEYAAQIGADGYAHDAGAAVTLARSILAR